MRIVDLVGLDRSALMVLVLEQEAALDAAEARQAAVMAAAKHVIGWPLNSPPGVPIHMLIDRLGAAYMSALAASPAPGMAGQGGQ